MHGATPTIGLRLHDLLKVIRRLKQTRSAARPAFPIGLLGLLAEIDRLPTGCRGRDLADHAGLDPSTVSRAVASKYVHTPQGVFELRYFFSEAVQGPSGGGTPLLLLKRKVKKMIEDEDRSKPLTDEQITMMLQREGINVTRRTVAKYREDMKIPSTHQRRVRN